MRTVLAINAGSSSLKLALFARPADALVRQVDVRVERIGDDPSRLIAQRADGRVERDEVRHIADHTAALRAAADAMPGFDEVDAIGHRVVRGGIRHQRPEVVTPALIDELRAHASLAPEHDPHSLALIAHIHDTLPGALQVACFDTSFHRRMPPVAQMYGLPRRMMAEGVVRLGFHGLSCEHIVDRLTAVDPMSARGRVIVAHLGNGASLTAIRDGQSADTTMGFSPTSGLVMGTRAGDVDPAVLLYLAEHGWTPDALRTMLNRESGLLGVSALTGDMQELLRRESTMPAAAEAVGLFCYTARKYLGAMTAVLGGLDTLVFTGGIGEHAAPVRERICTGLEVLGIALDSSRNASHDPVISSDESTVAVRVIPADEELTIAKHVLRSVSTEMKV